MRKNEGITLIALVITIIVVLLISGVSISMLSGENGILTKVNQAKEENQKATIEEKIKMAVMGSIGDTGKVEYDKLKDNINNISISGISIDVSEKSFPIVIKIGGFYVEITEYGNVRYLYLPQEYQDVEYIESSGMEYIDTGYLPNGNCKIECEFNTNVMNRWLFGIRPNMIENCYGVFLNNDTTMWYQYGTTGSQSGEISVYFNKWSNLLIDANELYLNDSLINSKDKTTIVSQSSMLLFAMRTGNSVDNRMFIGKIRYLKISDNNDLIRYMVPCYKDDEVGMYDLINDVFYTNKGTGTFLKGNDI